MDKVPRTFQMALELPASEEEHAAESQVVFGAFIKIETRQEMDTLGSPTSRVVLHIALDEH
ncbi:hypothetical protein P691DRAFT_808130 [Macrolepiota fuliginosa MF-IS2]|uniref:Uncharacterized protein n=1 Tax=Macrolepiota fuliginosa MF-IS2 TaxID=1400762 RepID=A0A9P5X333_9AGAR|nr:hypothetical protein P691DRAFT_808130 [Macrolepiota fuliginosa MF-IS2]